MPTVYQVTVKNKPGSVFPQGPCSLTWKNLCAPALETEDCTHAFFTPGGLKEVWQNPNRQLEIGEKLFRFLDGEKHLLQQALDQASRSGEPLTLLLCTCKPIADWPFELLAQGHSFLLPQRLHLVRCVSDWGADTHMQPQDRPLKLLFMACSALDVKPELDFEREEETIFHVTTNLPVDMEVEDSGSLEGLREQLFLDRYDVVHLSGHADIN